MMLEDPAMTGAPTIEIPPPPTPGGESILESGLNTPAVASEAPKKKSKPKSKAKKATPATGAAGTGGVDENATNVGAAVDASSAAGSATASTAGAGAKDGDKVDAKTEGNKPDKPEKPEKSERDENATSNLNKKRGPLLTKLNILEQQHFLARKGFPHRSSRPKTHWDYTIEEMQWMAIDFRQELRWKTSICKALAYACKESMEERASRFYQIRKLAIKNTNSEETQRMKLVARKIASIVKTTWKEWQTKLEQKANLLLLNHNQEETASFTNNTRIPEKFLSPEGIESTIETILSIPSIVHSNSVPCNFPLPPFDFKVGHNNKGSSSSGYSSSAAAADSSSSSKVCKMMEHQELIYREILRLNQIGFGAMVYGTSYSGKTVSISHALLYNLVEEAKKDKASPTSQNVCGVVIATQHGIWHWLLVFHQYCHPYVDVKVWNDEEGDAWLDSNLNKDRREGFPLIILVPIEKFEVFKENQLWLALNQIESNNPGLGNHPHTKNMLLAGLVVDLRGSQRQNPNRNGGDVSLMMSGNDEPPLPNGGNLGSVPTTASSNGLKYSEHQSHYQLLATISNYLPSKFTNRVLITDDNFRIIERISTLSYLIPGIPYRLLYQRFNFEPSSSTNSFVLEVYRKNPESQIIPLEQINKNTLHQLLINLSIHAMIPGDRNTRAYAQIREEINFVELTPSQQRKYDDITSVLVRSGFYTGSDIEKLTRILALLKLICFHSDFATIKKIPTVMNMMNPNSSSYLTYKPSVTKSTQLSTNNDNPSSTPSLMSIFFSQGSLVSKLGHVSHLNHNIMPSAASIDSSYASTSSASSSASAYGIHTKSDDPGELLMQGSNKLRALKGLLQRFSGLRVVVVASHWMEVSLIHQFLELQGIEHIYPHLYLKYGQQSTVATNWNFPNPPDGNGAIPGATGNLGAAGSATGSSGAGASSPPNPFSEIPNMEKLFWLAQESNIQLFNDPSVLSCILLTTYHAFQSPSTSPWLADAVILLSHHWESYYDLKNCFRMRLLHTGPQGDPVTIVRVCSKSTVEEVICKQKVGIPQLQGFKLSDLYFNIKDNTSQLNANNINNTLGGTTTSTDFDSGLTTMPFLRSAPAMPSIKSSGQSIHNIFGHHNSNNSLFNLVHSPMGIDNPSGYSKTASFFNERSAAANFIGGLPLESDSQNNSGNESNSSAPTLVRRKSGGGKGMIVLGPQGKTHFVKEPAVGNGATNGTGNGGFNSYGWTSARSGILSALYTLDEEQHKTDETKSERQLTYQWLQTFHNNIQQALCELSSAPFSNVAPPPTAPGTSTATASTVAASSSSPSNHLELILNGSSNVIDEAADRKQKLLTGVYEMVVYQTYYILQNRARKMVQDSNDAVTTSGANWIPKNVVCEMSINAYFLETVYKLLSAAHLNSDPTSDIFDIAMKIESSDDENKITKNMERMKLKSQGIGISDHQACIAKNFFVAPNTKSVNYVSLREVPNDEEGIVSAPLTITNSGGLAKSAVFVAFKETIQEMMYNGTVVDPWLFVNPLQTAARSDQVKYQSYTSGWDREDLGLKLKYVHKGMPVKPPTTKKATKANITTAATSSNPAEVNAENGNGVAEGILEAIGGMSSTTSFKDLEAAAMPIDDMSLPSSNPYGSSSNKKRKAPTASVSMMNNYTTNTASISVDLQDSMIMAGQSLTNDGMWNDDVDMIVDDDFLTADDLADTGNSMGSTSLQADMSIAGYHVGNDMDSSNNKRMKPDGTLDGSHYQNNGQTGRYSYGASSDMNSNSNGFTTSHATSNTNFHTSSMSTSGFGATGNSTAAASGEGASNSNYFYNSSSQDGVKTAGSATAASSSFQPPAIFNPSAAAAGSESNSRGAASTNNGSTSNGVNVWNGPQLLNQHLSPHGLAAANTPGGTMANSSTAPSSSYFQYPQSGTNQQSSFLLPPVTNALASTSKPNAPAQAVLLGGGPIGITPGNQITTNMSGQQKSLLPITSSTASSSTLAASSSTSSTISTSENDSTLNKTVSSKDSDVSTNAPSSSSAANKSTVLPSPSITSTGTEDAWLPVEDDIMICMQNATNDPNFVYTIHWLNNAKGISRTSPRTESQARTRYNSLCQSGKRDVRLSDPNVIRTIAKLKKSMKRPNSGASTSSAAVMSSNVINPSSSANILETTTSSQLHTSTSSSHVNSSDNNAAPSNNPEA